MPERKSLKEMFEPNNGEKEMPARQGTIDGLKEEIFSLRGMLKSAEDDAAEAHEAGWAEGYSAGHEAGVEEGTARGYDNGRQDGYDEGVDAGIELAHMTGG